jgi:hypothetical protein
MGIERRGGADSRACEIEVTSQVYSLRLLAHWAVAELDAKMERRGPECLDENIMLSDTVPQHIATQSSIGSVAVAGLLAT